MAMAFFLVASITPYLLHKNTLSRGLLSPSLDIRFCLPFALGHSRLKTRNLSTENKFMIQRKDELTYSTTQEFQSPRDPPDPFQTWSQYIIKQMKIEKVVT